MKWPSFARNSRRWSRRPDQLSFDILRGKMIVAPDAMLTAPQVVSAVARTGMRAEPWTDVQRGAAQTSFWQRRGRTFLTAASGAFSLAGFAAHASVAGIAAAFGSEGTGLAESAPPPVAIALYVAGIVSGSMVRRAQGMECRSSSSPGHEPADDRRRRWRGASLASGSKRRSSRFSSRSRWPWNPGVSEGQDGRSKHCWRLRHRLRAYCLPDGIEREVPAADVAVGTRILIKPGDRVALDGAVVRAIAP